MESSLFSIELSKSELKSFTTPLKDIQRAKINQVLLHFNDEENTIEAYCVNDSNTIMCNIEYLPTLLEKATFSSTFTFGIYDLNEFINCVSVFSDGATIKIDNNLCEISDSKDNIIKYHASDSSLIRQGKKTIKAKVEWYTGAEFAPSEYSTFMKSLNVINGQHVIFTGKEENEVLNIQVRDKDISSSNSSNLNVPTSEISKQFKTVIEKDSFISTMSSSPEEFSIKISNMIIVAEGSTEIHNVKYVIAPLV